MSLNVIISGGGTGGHIFPAIAIASELNKIPNSKVLFIGAKNRMEMSHVPSAGFKIKGLWISGFNRRNYLKNILLPLKIVYSLFKCFLVISKNKPNVVVGTGGFASGPLVFSAALMGIPSIIQEQNAFPGVTNRILSKFANVVCLGNKKAINYFPKKKVIVTGNPLRYTSNNKSKTNAFKSVGLSPNKLTILVIGGSLGSARINQLIKYYLKDFMMLNVQLFWQCGKIYEQKYKTLKNKNVHITPFIENMSSAYQISDIVISRAGALAISELSFYSKPTLFIPSPNVSENHQEKNAESLVNENAALMVREDESDEKFWPFIKKLIEDDFLRKKLSTNISKNSYPKATMEIVNLIKKYSFDE